MTCTWSRRGGSLTCTSWRFTRTSWGFTRTSWGFIQLIVLSCTWQLPDRFRICLSREARLLSLESARPCHTIPPWRLAHVVAVRLTAVIHYYGRIRCAPTTTASQSLALWTFGENDDAATDWGCGLARATS